MLPDVQRRLVVDIDGVIVEKESEKEYSERNSIEEVVETLRGYADNGFYIILHTARNMRTYEGRIGKINAETAPVLIKWLDEHEIPYDEIRYGKPWCGHQGFYVDDRAIRPDEFANLDLDEIQTMLATDGL